MEQLLLFVTKVVALEALRRASNAKCRPIWWGLQGVSLLQTPPFKWLQKWSHVRRLTECTQGLSKPMLFLSVATSFAGALEERQGNTPSTADTDASARKLENGARNATCSKELLDVKLKLGEEGEMPTDRLDEDELGRFLVAANNDPQRCVFLLRRTLRWRERYYFLSPREINDWSNLVHWHGRDTLRRPVLVIRLGLAYSTLAADDRPRFAQAVVSQVEHGVMNLVHKDDARLTVIMDCNGTTAIGFPVGMMKSCSILVQEHYPTRLASLYVINLPAVVKVVANAIIQVLKPVTRQKIHVEGDQFLSMLGEVVGGIDKVPASVGGSCTCMICSKKVEDVMVGRQVEGVERNDGVYEEDLEQSWDYNSVIRKFILALLMIWIMVSMMAGFYDPH